MNTDRNLNEPKKEFGKRKAGSGTQGAEHRERNTGSGEQGAGSRERRAGSGEQGAESRERRAGSGTLATDERRKGKVEPQRHRGTEKAEREWAALKAPPWFGGGMVRWEAKAESGNALATDGHGCTRIKSDLRSQQNSTCWSGKGAALLPLPPLRTGRESFPSSGSSRYKAPRERSRPHDVLIPAC